MLNSISLNQMEDFFDSDRSTAPDLSVLNDLVEKLASDAKKTQREYDLMMAQVYK